MELSPEEKQRILEEKTARLIAKAVKTGEHVKKTVSFLSVLGIVAACIGVVILIRSNAVSDRPSQPVREKYVQPTRKPTTAREWHDYIIEKHGQPTRKPVQPAIKPRQINTANDWSDATQRRRLEFARIYISILKTPGVEPSALVQCIDGAITGWGDKVTPSRAATACLVLSGQ